MADNRIEIEVNLSFAGYGYALTVKLNRPLQIELLERRPAYIVKIILPATAIFWDLNFVSYSCHTLNLAKKLGFKTKNLFNALVKKRI